MELLVLPTGALRGIYDEALDWPALGKVSIRRASHVEPDATGRWFADLSPAGGPRLGPFTLAQPGPGGRDRLVKPALADGSRVILLAVLCRAVCAGRTLVLAGFLCCVFPHLAALCATRARRASVLCMKGSVP